MAYLDSTKISAFPVVNRNDSISGDTYARHTSEQLLSGIINKFIDTDGFVITPQADFASNKPFAFNVHGYYFNVSTLSDILSLFSSPAANTTVYATISLVQNGNWYEISGGDVTSDVTPTADSAYHYTGLTLTSTTGTVPASTSTVFNFPILKYLGAGLGWVNGWYVPDTSYVKFDGPSFTLTEVSGRDYDLVQ